MCTWLRYYRDWEIETEMSIYFGNDRVHPVEYKLPVELLVVSMDIYEFVSKMLQKGAVLAREFQVCPTQISRIKTGKQWRHTLEDE